MIGAPARAILRRVESRRDPPNSRLGATNWAPRRITVNTDQPRHDPHARGHGHTRQSRDSVHRTDAPCSAALGEPGEVAALCQFLASDGAAFITGQNIAIDGGLTTGWTEHDPVPAARSTSQKGRWTDDFVNRNCALALVELPPSHTWRDAEGAPLMIDVSPGHFMMGATPTTTNSSPTPSGRPIASPSRTGSRSAAFRSRSAEYRAFAPAACTG